MSKSMTSVAQSAEATRDRAPSGVLRSWLLVGVLLAAIAVAAVLAYGGWFGSDEQVGRNAVHRVRRQDLLVKVQEGGQVIARVNLEIKSKVSGITQIIKMMPEGTYLTQQDVEDQRVLVVLDSQKLVDRLVQEEINLETARAGYADAREAYEIQKNQNESDINQAMLKVEFARMDLEKYLGAELARKLLAQHARDLEAARAEREEVRQKRTEEQPGAVDDVVDDEVTAPEAGRSMQADRVAGRMFEGHVLGRACDLLKVAKLDLPQYADADILAGEALQRSRQLKNDIKLNEGKLAQAREDHDVTQQLFEKRFAPKLELEKAELTLQQREVDVEKARTAYRIFVDYEFAKQATKLFSDYLESLEEMRRVEARTRSSLFQKHVRLMREKNNLRRNEDRVAHTREQIENSVIRATQPGLVVYATHGHWRNPTPVEEGANIRERQSIITIPDPATMAIDVKVPESKVRQLRKEMPALVNVDSMPGKPFRAWVHRVAILPEPSQWGMDVKVYKTIVAIDPQDPRTGMLKPGMAGSVEIFVQELNDVLTVPVQSVYTVGERRFVCLDQGDGYDLVEVEIGASDDAFVEIRSGLVEDDLVRLDPPADLREKLKAYEPTGDRNKLPEGIEMKDPSEYPKPGEGESEKPRRGRDRPKMTAEMREKLKNMSEEERRKVVQQMRDRSKASQPQRSGD